MKTQKREKLDAMNALLRYYECEVPLAKGLYCRCPFCELYLKEVAFGYDCKDCPWRSAFRMKYACEQWHYRWYKTCYETQHIAISETKQNRLPDFVQARIAMLQMWIAETISGE